MPQGVSAAPRSWNRRGGTLARSPQRENGPTGTSTSEGIHFCGFKHTQLVVFVTQTSGKSPIAPIPRAGPRMEQSRGCRLSLESAGEQTFQAPARSLKSVTDNMEMNGYVPIQDYLRTLKFAFHEFHVSKNRILILILF